MIQSMKRVAAFVLSLMLIGLQVMASAPIAFSPATAKSCCGCGCEAGGCCVRESNPAGKPVPASPAPINPHHEICLLPAEFMKWALPASRASLQADSSFSSPHATAVPLFTRHCALLI